MSQITLKIENREGINRTETFYQESVSIGRDEGNDIVVTRNKNPFPENNVYWNTGRTHGILTNVDGKLLLIDAGTSNGVHCINGQKILPRGYYFEIGDQYYVGDFRITIVAVSSEDSLES